MATRWMPPDRSMAHDTASGLLPPMRVMVASSALGQVLVPAELLQHGVGELRIAVLELAVLGVDALGQQVVLELLLDLLAARVLHLDLDHALDAEAGAEGAAAVLHGHGGVVEDRRARMAHLRRAPARPRQAVVVAADVGARWPARKRHDVELALVLHVRLEPLGRLAAVAGRPAAAIDLAQD